MGKQQLGSQIEADQLSARDYVHLHNHTHHSLLDGLTKIPELVDRVKDLGMYACAITDHGTMSGAIEFYKTANASGVKPIIGIETYVAMRTRQDRDPAKDKQRFHLILLAMNNTGYANLMKLASLAELEGKYYKPRIDHELIEQYNEGLICLSACASGEVGESLRNDDYEKAKQIASWYKSIFGDRYYLELQDHGHEDSKTAWDVQIKINKYLVKLADELKIECVVTSDAHYVDHVDQDAHEILLCVGTGSYLSDEKRMSLKDFELHVADPQDIIDRWQKVNPEAIRNTRRIAERCQVELELGKILIPTFPTPNGESEKEYLDTLVYRGMSVRYHNFTPDEAAKKSVIELRQLLNKPELERLDMELDVLERMGYNGYFLIVQDFINWGKNQGIIFGPGRGSAAGSIIAYALNITDLDPLKYDLLFERFLNPDRISMPDIDIDIQDTRRDEVIAYCAEKYGDARVANIVTFGKMAARAAVRDVARVLEVPYAEADRMSKMIPPPVQGRHIPLAVSIKEDADLINEYESNPNAKKVFDYAIRLEGTIRSHGVHAAGVVIAPDDIVNYVPLEMSQKGVVATQYPMGPVEEIGLLKMDFLGLSNLSIINNALRIIKTAYKNEIILSEIPLDDAKTFELFQRGDTTGVFQLESAGMKRYLRELKPNVFDDIIAMVALYRPGPMQFIDSFIRRKHGEEPITYLHPKMESALASTYGVLVYQEQFMQISKDLAGFTGGQADTLRKAVGKKILEMMKKVKPEFIEGAINHSGADRQDMEKFWAQLEEFANYCFNKSHAACYGLIAYWTAYLKAHYPDAFMAALMTSDADNIERLAIEISECRHMGIEVLAPDVNQSFVEFAVVPSQSKIRFGMAAVKGVGVGAVEEILRARKDGEFKTIEDFAKRVSMSKVNKKTWEALIKSGGFDSLADRSDILFNLDAIQVFASKLQKEALSGQVDLFGSLGSSSGDIHPSLQLQTAPVRFTEKEQLLWERELLGLYISAHPLDNFSSFFEEQTVPLTKIAPNIDGQVITVGGIVTRSRSIVTKSGKKMAFVQIEDKFGEAEIIIFPNLYDSIQDILHPDTIMTVSGKVSARDRDGNLGDEAKLIADTASLVSDKDLQSYQSNGQKMISPQTRAPYRKRVAKSASASKASPIRVMPETKPIQTLYIRVDDASQTDILLSIKRICSDYPGASTVIMVIGEQKKALRMPFQVGIEEALMSRLSEVIDASALVCK